MKRRVFLFLLGIIPLLVHGQADTQYYHNYAITNGVDSSLWVTLPSYDVNLAINEQASELRDMGFSFYFFDDAFRSLSINRQGSVRFGTRYTDRGLDLEVPFPSNQGSQPIDRTWTFHTPYIIPFGMLMYQGTGSYARWGVVGEAGQRKVVCDFNLAYRAELPAHYRCQVQLWEADGSVVMMYQHDEDTNWGYTIGTIGMALNPLHWISYNQNTHVSTGCEGHGHSGVANINCYWPGGDCGYVRFTPTTPICANPGRIYPQNVKQTTAEVTWRRSANDDYYIYQVSNAPTYNFDRINNYDWTADSSGGYNRLRRLTAGTVTRDTLIHLTNLVPGECYEVLVATVCRNGDTSSTQKTHLFTYLPAESGNKFDYANIYSPHVSTTNGTYTAPLAYDERIDYGPLSTDSSRHTVCSNRAGTDDYTYNSLHTVPTGYSHSVRIGNDQHGAQAESITYRLDVDTLEYDLLLFHYANVEQDPDHDDPPKFQIDFLDSLGNLWDSCYHINFLSTSTSGGWLQGDDCVWKQWSSVGLDLTPLHGQRILIRATNYDCGIGAHFGYSYLTVESSTKGVHSNKCSDSQNTTFHAPAGFTYRWYREDTPTVTLSTADSVNVSLPGYYCCWVGYRHDPTCGFSIRAYAGPRTPVAQYHAERLDSCGHRYRFVNESYLVQDNNGTRIDGVMPEAYLWRFDDGTTSTDIHPEHEFYEGRHLVELVALEGGGECRDSLTTAVVMEPEVHEIYDSMCVGGSYPFHDTLITTAGTYRHDEGCDRDILHLYLYEPYAEHHDDTVCRGEGIWVRDQYYDDEEYHRFVIPGPYGCDSTFTTQLTLREWPVPEIGISQTCRGEAYYTVTLTPGWEYRWSSDPTDPTVRFLEGETSVRLNPSAATQYVVEFSYKTEPRCAVSDTFELTPISYVNAAIAVSPEFLDMDRTTLLATDVSKGSNRREWYVNGLPADTLRQVSYELPLEEMPDSVLLLLVAYNPSCRDTALRTVPVLRHQLFFPNIFTPDQDINNGFRPVGFAVTDYELYLYDRRGVRVFQTTDPAEAWDGTCQGLRCPQGSYAWVCRYTIPTGERKQQTGVVSLIR